jgi:hypothetical protein
MNKNRSITKDIASAYTTPQEQFLTRIRDAIPIFLILSIIFLTYRSFGIIPGSFQDGAYDISVFSYPIIFCLFGLSVFFIPSRFITRNFAILVYFYVFMVGVHILLASIYYKQGISSGIRIARFQSYCILLFPFMWLLRNEYRIDRVLAGVAVFSAGAMVVTISAYAGFDIFDVPVVYYDVRADIHRPWFPGPIVPVSLAFLWCFSKWLSNNRKNLFGLLALVFISYIVFAQRRGDIFGVTLAVAAAVLATRKGRGLIALCVAGMITVAAIEAVSSKENILVYQFSSAAEYFEKEDQGRIGGRSHQFEVIVDEFLKYPVAGSGLAALSPADFHRRKREAYEMLRANADWGYPSFIKIYGSMGIIWLVGFLYALWRTNRRILQSASERTSWLHHFTLAGSVYIAFTGITQNYFMQPFQAVLLWLFLAMLMQVEDWQVTPKGNMARSGIPARRGTGRGVGRPLRNPINP